MLSDDNSANEVISIRLITRSPENEAKYEIRPHSLGYRHSHRSYGLSAWRIASFHKLEGAVSVPERRTRGMLQANLLRIDPPVPSAEIDS